MNGTAIATAAVETTLTIATASAIGSPPPLCACPRRHRVGTVVPAPVGSLASALPHLAACGERLRRPAPSPLESDARPQIQHRRQARQRSGRRGDRRAPRGDITAREAAYPAPHPL